MRLFLLLCLLSSTIVAEQVQLTLEQSNYIAEKIWNNEGAGLDENLLHWNDGEDFASVGIGHFIWFPKGHKELFTEAFPILMTFLEQKKVKVPNWLNSRTDLPWSNQAAFKKAKKENSLKYRELFSFLKTTRAYQAEFMAQRINTVLPKMLYAETNQNSQKIITQNFYKVMKNVDGSLNERGLYILIDYLNFKGDGTLKRERYKGEGWGLSQVLAHLDTAETDTFKAFSDSAKTMLGRRIANSPASRGEERWREGWYKRLDTYWQ